MPASEPTTEYADVTVIVPAYRAAATIERALASVAGQTSKPKTVIVVDDGSPDNTATLAENYRASMQGIDLKVLRQANAGPGAARNRAIEEADTTYIAFLDADDEWLSTKLSRTMTHFEDADFVLVAHDSVEIDGNSEIRLDCARRFHASAKAPYAGLFRMGFIDTTTVVMRLDAVRAVGGFDITLPNAQDFELWLAVLSDPKATFHIFGEVLSRYHRQPRSVMTHIERRRRCCMHIALRYASILRQHPGWPMASFAFRILAVHREAAVAHFLARQWLPGLRAIAILPANWMLAMLHYLLRRPSPRRGSFK